MLSLGTNQTILQKCLWGDVSPSPHVSAEIRHSRNPALCSADVVLRVEVAQHDLRIHGCLPVRRAWCAVESAFTLDDRQLQEETEFIRLLNLAVRDLSFLLREHDPRIGTKLAEGQTKDFLPKLPLFDPPRIRPPAWTKGSGIDAIPCPLCSDGFGQGYPAMWGGGNLQWVHHSCWVRAHE